MRTLKEYAKIVNERLENVIPAFDEGAFSIGEMPWLLSKSMNYSLSAGGKRLRPSMLLAAVEMMGGEASECIDFACSVEMIHTYSLIHDDLPGMDNDSMRRGRPTNHVVFGEGQAILAGDGLLNYAFETMLKAAVSDREKAYDRLLAIREIATGAGVAGMIGGQVMDLYCENNRKSDRESLEYIQYGKTACMFIYPLRAAGRLCGASEDAIKALTEYGCAFGRLFQATDDLLDVIGDSEAVGKTLGKDQDSGKLTCVSAYGLEGTKKLVEALRDEALAAISYFGEKARFFEELVHSMVGRTY
ncbi:MAG: polyprenyl synthetase family protein [Clostridiales bacterium]|nr:polyprenyl synthetase family protein [Clostridiales bacterium]